MPRFVVVAAAALVLTGCPSRQLVTGSIGVTSQAGYGLNTHEDCVRPDLAVAVADRALPLAFRGLVAAGYIADASRALRERPFNRTAVCLLRLPEACSFAGWTVGPLGPTPPGASRPLAARKRGCASYATAWTSLCWPPKCRSEWPDEPHCVDSAASTRGWEGALIHEVVNLARARWATGAAAGENDYAKLPSLFGPGGVESRVLTAYGERKHVVDEGCK